MSQGEKQITCRKCREDVPISAGNCPHCGTSIRSAGMIAAVILFGTALVVASLFNLSELLVFGAVGLVIAAVGGFLLYDRRQRTTGSEESEESVVSSLE